MYLGQRDIRQFQLRCESHQPTLVRSVSRSRWIPILSTLWSFDWSMTMIAMIWNELRGILHLYLIIITESLNSTLYSFYLLSGFAVWSKQRADLPKMKRLVGILTELLKVITLPPLMDLHYEVRVSDSLFLCSRSLQNLRELTYKGIVRDEWFSTLKRVLSGDCHYTPSKWIFFPLSWSWRSRWKVQYQKSDRCLPAIKRSDPPFR
jgi:hypothetical protein